MMNRVEGHTSERPKKERPVCPFAAASLLLPFVSVLLVTGSELSPEWSTLDNALPYGPVGMFWIKLGIYSVVPILCASLAILSFGHIKRHPHMEGKAAAIAGFVLGVIWLCSNILELRRLYGFYLGLGL